MNGGDLPPSETVGIARNYRDGCVWLIFDNGRKCVPPERARMMANAIVWRFGPFDDEDEGDDYQTQQLVDDLRDAAADVEHASGDDR